MAIFDWFKPRALQIQPTRQPARRPQTRDFSSELTVNRDLTYGIYHNSYAGLKLSAGMGFPAIAIPVYFMGFPVLKVEDEELSEKINEILERQIRRMRQIHIESHRDGTIWIWPTFSSTKQMVEWEFLPDDVVQDVIRDINTNEIIEIWTDEELRVRTGKNETENIRRIRHYTKTQISVSYSGGRMPQGLKDRTQRNVLGIMPIAFANNQDGDEIRGHSDFERILSLLKAYHDIAEAEYSTLAKFKAKMIQDVNDVDTWLANNGFDAITDIDISAIDFIFNLPNKGEKTEFIFAKNITEEHRNAKRQIFHQIVEASGIPEIIWGIKTVGNHASTEENMATLAQYVSDKQEQKTEQYRQLFEATLKLQAIAELREIDISTMTVEWNDLDSVSEKVRSEIFKNFTAGLKEAFGAGAMSLRQAWKFWTALYPSATEDDYDEWAAGIRETAVHNQFTTASYLDALDAAGLEGDETEIVNIIQGSGNGTVKTEVIVEEIKNYFMTR